MKILRIHDVLRITGLSRTTIWRLEHKGDFPKKIRLCRNCIGYHADEIEAWISALPRAGTPPQKDEAPSPFKAEA